MHHDIRFTLRKITQRLKLIEPLVYREREPLAPFRFYGHGDVLADDRDHTSRRAPPIEIPPNSFWGRPRMEFVLRSVFSVEWANGRMGEAAGKRFAHSPIRPFAHSTARPFDRSPIRPFAYSLFLPIGEAGDFSHPEALVVIDDEPWAACDRHHQEVPLKPEHCDGETHTLELRGWTGLGGWRSEVEKPLYMGECAVVRVDGPTREFVALVRVALGVAENLPEDDPARARLLNALEVAFKILDTRDPLGGERFYESVGPALEALQGETAEAGPPLDVVIHAAGHAHIDVAWLWTLGQTREKSRRTFTNVMRLMEQFPEYRFTQSQPQLYEYVREDDPALFAAIRERVREGRWEPIGGMWVEADCNLSGAESLARQFLLGRRYFREHFGEGAESPVLWLPDVFGYAWALPQLIQQAGLKYFMTIKIGWSQYNRLPYDTFLWQGLDGTQVLTHFSTVKAAGSPHASTYNSKADPSEALGAWSNFQQKELHKELLMAYGYGDGGGGPTREMLENIEIMGDFPGLPQVRSSSVREFFEAIDQGPWAPRLPTWDGELYLEYHRGTYTTQARVKRANRKAEFALHDAEFLAAYASVAAGFEYPHGAFRAAWRTVCLNQFHDIIPGSSIAEVYEESLAQYEELMRDVAAIRDAALAALAGTDHWPLKTGDQSPVSRFQSSVILANPTSFPQPGIVFVQDGSSGYVRDGEPLQQQPSGKGAWIDAGELGPYSIVALERVQLSGDLIVKAEPPLPIPGPEESYIRAADRIVLENDLVRCEFDSFNGGLARFFDKTSGREVLPAGQYGNQFQAFEDRPLNWDAWDVDIFYDDKVWIAELPDSIEWIETGPLRQTLEIRRQILNSTIVQRISLNRGSARLDFETEVDWQERHVLLKVAFPVDILSPAATYEIQWGSVQRQTHRNRSWDWARFESCAQKWVDLSEGDYGVSLLNDCKYGHDVRGNVLRLTLLRSPTFPDPEADRGMHRFTYSLLPHAGSWDDRTIGAAYGLNDPVIVSQAGDRHFESDGHLPAPGLRPPSFVSVDSPNVVIETVKVAEDGRGVIVRLYESQRMRGEVVLTAGFAIGEAWITNLLEEDAAALEVEGNRVRLQVRPFQILTVRVTGIAEPDN